MLWLTYVMIGWWAALICATFVLVMWNGHDAREIARHDAMTGLLSRAGFDARLSDALEAVRKRGRAAALLAIDLDGFKGINDTHGHAVGDDVIRAVGARLRSAIRLTDAAVRSGGDEFGVLLVDVDDRLTAEAAARRIHDTICEPIELHDRVVGVGASIGVVVIAASARMPSIGRLHDSADRLMYEAKRAGGGLQMDRARPVQAGLPDRANRAALARRGRLRRARTRGRRDGPRRTGPRVGASASSPAGSRMGRMISRTVPRRQNR